LADAKIQLYESMRAGRVPKAELARRLGIPRQQIERLLDLRHSSRLEQIEAAFRAILWQQKADFQSAAGTQPAPQI